MSTFFGKPTPPRVEDHPAHRTSGDQSYSNGNSKPSSEKESTLPDEPLRGTAAGLDTDKEAANNGNRNGNDSPEAVPNEDSNKESVAHGEEEKQTSNPEESNESGESSADPKEVDDTKYPSGWRLFLITVALCLCVFCVALVRLLLGTQSIRLLTID
jgi:hypothetical protein